MLSNKLKFISKIISYGEVHVSKTVHDLAKEFEEIGCTCDRPFCQVEAVSEVHNMITARSVAGSLDIPNITVHTLFCGCFCSIKTENNLLIQNK